MAKGNGINLEEKQNLGLLIKEINMPYGKGTYGSKVGRPKKTKKAKPKNKKRKKK